jgi:hypothetical protein
MLCDRNTNSALNVSSYLNLKWRHFTTKNKSNYRLFMLIDLRIEIFLVVNTLIVLDVTLNSAN